MFKCEITNIYGETQELELPFLPCAGMRIAYSSDGTMGYSMRQIIKVHSVEFDYDNGVFRIEVDKND